MEKHIFCVPLTKSSMLIGVTVDFLIFDLIMWASLSFLTLNFIWPTLLAILLFGVMWVLCRVEPRFPDILFKKIQYFRLENYWFWGCSSYEPY